MLPQHRKEQQQQQQQQEAVPFQRTRRSCRAAAGAVSPLPDCVAAWLYSCSSRPAGVLVHCSAKQHAALVRLFLAKLLVGAQICGGHKFPLYST